MQLCWRETFDLSALTLRDSAVDALGRPDVQCAELLGGPVKTRMIVSFALFVTAALIAQTSNHRTSPVRVPSTNTNAPTKVTGDGVKTDSGLQYWDIKVGTGQVANDGDHVKVHYTGWFTDGKKFDSSVDANQPYSFTIGKGEVIKGWDEGVTGMKVGGKRQLRIPPELAYGDAGYKKIIPPNATLIFDVQLLAVSPAQTLAPKPSK